MYPPFNDKRYPIPPLKEENTGKPIIPNNIYINIEHNPFLPPRHKSVINIPNVCNVKGITKGMDIHEHIIIKVVNKPIYSAYINLNKLKRKKKSN